MGDALVGHVVVGRPDAAAGDHDVVGVCECAYVLGDDRHVIDAHHDASKGDPKFEEHLGGDGHVGLFDFAGEHFVADDEHRGGANIGHAGASHSFPGESDLEGGKFRGPLGWGPLADLAVRGRAVSPTLRP